MFCPKTILCLRAEQYYTYNSQTIANDNIVVDTDYAYHVRTIDELSRDDALRGSILQQHEQKKYIFSVRHAANDDGIVANDGVRLLASAALSTHGAVERVRTRACSLLNDAFTVMAPWLFRQAVAEERALRAAEWALRAKLRSFAGLGQRDASGWLAESVAEIREA